MRSMRCLALCLGMMFLVGADRLDGKKAVPERTVAQWCADAEQLARLLRDEHVDLIYAKYDLVERRGPGGERFSRFVSDLKHHLAERPEAPVVIDVRTNSGGNNRTYGPLLDLLVDSWANDNRRLFALIGRGTFSAAGNFIADRLDHSGIEVWIPTVYWQKGGPGDTRLTHTPQIPAPPRAADYFAGVDTALAAVRRALADR